MKKKITTDYSRDLHQQITHKKSSHIHKERYLEMARRPESFLPEQMTPHLEKLLGPIDADIKAGRNLSPAFTSAEEAIAWLRKQ
jgi:hypothetical protein